jgi:hypothetical protein
MTELQQLKNTIADAIDRLEALEMAQATNNAPVKWEPKGGCYFIDLSGNVYRSTSTHQSRSFGAERETKEQAEHAAEWMRKFNRLLCWVEENAPGHDIGIVFDLSDEVSIRFYADRKAIDDLRTKIRDGVVEL